MGYQRILIISGGKIDEDFAKEWIKAYQPDYTIAADSGMEFLRHAGLVPDMIIGDFDSVSAGTLAHFKVQEGIAVKQLNPMKDDTDTEAAIRQAIALGAEEITLLGATGSRIDHVLGNVALLGIGLKEQVVMRLVDSQNRIRMADKPFTLRKAEQFGRYVSLIPYAGDVEGVTLKGFLYPLEDYHMSSFSSLGISNEIVDEEAEVQLREGILLVIESRGLNCCD